MDIGRKIQSLRMKNNIKQSDLANIIGVSKSTMSNYERNYSTPDLDTLIHIADYFCVSIDFILDHTVIYEKNQALPAMLSDQITEYTSQRKISEEEKRLLFYFDRLNEENKDYIKGKMVDLYKEQQNSIVDKTKKGILHHTEP